MRRPSHPLVIRVKSTSFGSFSLNLRIWNRASAGFPGHWLCNSPRLEMQDFYFDSCSSYDPIFRWRNEVARFSSWCTSNVNNQNEVPSLCSIRYCHGHFGLGIEILGFVFVCEIILNLTHQGSFSLASERGLLIPVKLKNISLDVRTQRWNLNLVIWDAKTYFQALTLLCIIYCIVVIEPLRFTSLLQLMGD